VVTLPHLRLPRTLAEFGRKLIIMTRAEAGPVQISAMSKLAREAVLFVTPVVFPDYVETIPGSLARSEQLLREGNGLVVVINHFSKRDPVNALSALMRLSPEFKNRRVLAPIAHHQHTPMRESFTQALGVDLRPIVNHDTVAKGRQGKLRRGHGLRQYLDDGIDLLSQGGILLIAPQGGRRASLQERDEGSMDLMVRRLAQQDVANVAFMFVGLGIAGEQDYNQDRVGKYNVGKLYKIVVGPTISLPEISEKTAAADISVDELVYQQLGLLVPEAYRGTPEAIPQSLGQ